ncbi:MAG: DUF1707 and DUF2154 domain-containing protein [Actinobacteria bacterium]|nr:DUF1707 and DUF2154 domain-containing protein [Actinomycetota bacterium]
MDDASLRVSDADRERAVHALREHLLAGRLTLEEFSERVEAALRAKVAGDLARVQADLPVVFTGAAGPGRASARLTAALLGHVVRRGRLRLHGWAVAASVFADLDLDLRDATIDQRRTAVTVVAAFANVDVYVPEGVNVDVSGISVLGHRRDWGRDADRPDAPTVHVHVLGFVGTIDVWRVPHDMRNSSYDDIFRRLEDGQRQLPA